MAFESLTDKLQNVFKNLRSKGRLTEADVKTASEIRCPFGGGCQLSGSQTVHESRTGTCGGTGCYDRTESRTDGN